MLDQIAEIVSVPALDTNYYFHKIAAFFVGHEAQFLGFSQTIFGFIIFISIILSIVFFFGIIFAVEGLKSCRNKEDAIHNPPIEPAFSEEVKGDPIMTARWKRILEYIGSKNENDWRQAIIEADIMLEDLLVKLGYQGEGVGERLKRANKGDFKTLQLAWDAHTVRNRIAHDGSEHPIDQLEAQRVIGLFKQVFEEFYFI